MQTGRRRTHVALEALIACALALAAALALAPDARAATCRVLPTPAGLGATLLSLHRRYEAHQPDVHNPTITGPVGRVRLGACGGVRYALASFDARYNNVYFGTEDQPERFRRAPGGAWSDLGNTGGAPCGSAPTALLRAWGIVSGCSG